MRHLFLSLFTVLLFTSCSNGPQKLLNQAQNELMEYENINYTLKGFYPNPMGKIDIREAFVFLRKNEKSSIGYDFIINNKSSDNVHIDGVLKSINHRDKSVELFAKNKPEEITFHIKNNRFIKHSPTTLLNQIDWKFVQDTLIDHKKFKTFYRVENDTVVDGNKIYTEQHIYINSSSKLLERWERRNYYRETLSQTLVYKYKNYKLDKKNTLLNYNYPLNYKSIFYGQNKSKIVLNEGQKAPVFIGKDLQNKAFNLSDYLGKKVLLNFSAINCGYCKQSLNHFNQKDYKFSDDIIPVYINPQDEQKDVDNYANNINAQFSIIPNAKKIAETYGVSGYPMFFLIDEKGTIEEVVLGYNKEFLETLKAM